MLISLDLLRAETLKVIGAKIMYDPRSPIIPFYLHAHDDEHAALHGTHYREDSLLAECNSPPVDVSCDDITTPREESIWG
jgi:hypothetical protein